MKKIRAKLHKLFQHFGFDVVRFIPPPPPDPNRKPDIPADHWDLRWLDKHQINTVLDIGANDGQFTVSISRFLPHAKFLCFEPLPSVFSELQKAIQFLPNAQAINCAVGETTGTVTMNRNEFSPSSSLLEMTDLHRGAFPFTAQTFTESVKLETLDNLLASMDLKPQILMKIDVQGYENAVLAGAKDTLRRVRCIIVEAAFTTLYAGQSRFQDIYATLTASGFTYIGSLDPLKDPRDGTILHEDAFFLRQ